MINRVEREQIGHELVALKASLKRRSAASAPLAWWLPWEPRTRAAASGLVLALCAVGACAGGAAWWMDRLDAASALAACERAEAVGCNAVGLLYQYGRGGLP